VNDLGLAAVQVSECFACVIRDLYAIGDDKCDVCHLIQHIMKAEREQFRNHQGAVCDERCPTKQDDVRMAYTLHIFA
jgi:hypothetical protein